MTLDEAIKELKDASYSEARYGDKDNHRDEVMKRIEAFDMAIQVLAQQPCEDCIREFISENGTITTDRPKKQKVIEKEDVF